MFNSELINYEYKENFCELKMIVPIKNRATTTNTPDGDGGGCCVGDGGGGAEVAAGATSKKCAQNLRNFDVYIENNHFLIYIDIRLYKFHSPRCFNIKAINELLLNYEKKEQLLTVTIPCLPLRKDTVEGTIENIWNERRSLRADEKFLDLWNLKRITDNCYLQIDNGSLMKSTANFGYGFSNKFYGRLKKFESDADMSLLLSPEETSPLKRSIVRYMDEMKAFCPDQYKLNFVELQIPDGHINPAKFVVNYKDTFTTEEEQLLHNLTCKEEVMEIATDEDQVQIDCGLISILMAICYDVRSTCNDPSCESAWTRSILSSVFNYFETFQNIRDIVISFYRRSLIYPYYRSYDFSRQCIEDCIRALQFHPKWILKQLLVTCQLFENSGRTIFNYYYIHDYIYYVANSTLCPTTHLQILSRNLKNVLFDINKKHLGLSLLELEKNLIKELITDVDVDLSNSDDGDDNDNENEDANDADESDENEYESDEVDGDDDDDEYVDDDDDEDCNDNAEEGSESYDSELCNSNEESSDTEENSVIEKQMQNMNLIG